MSEIKVENFKNYLELFFPQSEKLLRQDVWGVFLSACWMIFGGYLGCILISLLEEDAQRWRWTKHLGTAGPLSGKAAELLLFKYFDLAISL